jgi:adenosine deaminase
MLELAAERNVAMPMSSAADLARHMVASDTASLEEYLERFETTLSVMQDPEALERIAYELIEDHAAENVRYVEVRFCPALNTRQGMSGSDVLAAVSTGLGRAGTDHGVRWGIIVCALRSLPPPHSNDMADLAVGSRADGVVGFDLAGAEAGYPVRDHVEAFDRVDRAGLPITIHAGEGFGPESIREALALGHARRIGHGTRLLEDATLMEHVRSRRILLETCLTSNVQTGVVATYGDHPVRRYVSEGIPVALSTDNRLMSGVTLTREYQHARDDLGFGWDTLVAMARAGFEHAFASEAVRTAMVDAFDEAVAAAGGTTRR